MRARAIVRRILMLATEQHPAELAALALLVVYLFAMWGAT